jgi:serine/threonine protein kinase
VNIPRVHAEILLVPIEKLSPMPPYPSREGLPRSFGRYRLDELLGTGGMGSVYRARDTVLDVDVALKIPHPELMRDPVSRERFYHEARAAARLDHPNFARVCDVGEHDGTLYLTMRFVPGMPISNWPAHDPGDTVDLIRTLASALAEAHRRGVIHRDLKPSNVLIMPDGTPVITDFGLALRLDSLDTRLTSPGVAVGTPLYMAPEQYDPEFGPLGPACDIYALGVMFYKLLTGGTPFPGSNIQVVRDRVLFDEPDPPSTQRSGLDSALDSICLKALAKYPEDRYPDMDHFAEALGDWLAGARTTPEPNLSRESKPKRPTVPRACLRFAFLGLGEQVADPVPGRLFLDVGNNLRPGVIDHHQQTCAAGSTTSLVLQRPDLVLGAVSSRRDPDQPFTLVLHEWPDLDGVAAAWLAAICLETGTFPPGSTALARYVDKVDEGSLGLSLANPFSLYAGYLQLVDRAARQSWNSPIECWQECVRQGLQVVGYAVAEGERRGVPLPAVDAFACPDLFGPDDRKVIHDDADRYVAKLREPSTRARKATLQLPGQFGGTIGVQSLRVRDVQNAYDPERCVYFKDWARTDSRRAGNGKGFEALSVFMSEGPGQARRCILSVTPDSATSLRGLGALLDYAETERRRAIYGSDDRVTDPATGTAKPPRPGYTNADPWYDGRAHGYTIVDAPRTGTLLTADEIDAVFLRFGATAS